MTHLWTVARFPNGSWTYGGSPDSPDYSECEVYQVEAIGPKEAIKKGRSQRDRRLKKERKNDPHR